MTSAQTNVSTNFDKNKLVSENINLVYYVYHKYIKEVFKKYIEKDDLVSAGKIGLVRAAKNYDGRATFSTFAVIIIRNAMLQLCRKLKSKRNVPEWLKISIETPVSNDNTEIKLIDTLCANDDIKYTDLKIDIENFKGALSEQNILVFNMHVAGYTQEQIANTIGKSQTVVSRIINRIKTKFKEFYYG